MPSREWTCCPLCSSNNRGKCSPPVTGRRCALCQKYVGKGNYDCPQSIRLAPPFPIAAVDEALTPGLEALSICTNGLDNEYGLEVKIRNPADGSNVDCILPIREGPESSDTICIPPLIEALRSTLSPELRAKNDGQDAQYISDSIDVSGILYTLCSIVSINANNFQQPGASFFGHANSDYRPDLQLKRSLVHQSAIYIDRVLRALRGQENSKHQSPYTCNTYGAAAILQFEVDYFLKHLRKDTHISTGLEGPFSTWLIAVDEELLERVREGCGTYPKWRSGIHGSMKAFHQRHRNSKSLDLSLRVRPIKNIQLHVPHWALGPATGTFPPLGFDHDSCSPALKSHSLSHASQKEGNQDPHTTDFDPQNASPATPEELDEYSQLFEPQSDFGMDAFFGEYFPSQIGPTGIEFDSAGKMPNLSQPMIYDQGNLPIEQRMFLDPSVLQNTPRQLTADACSKLSQSTSY